MFFYRAYGLNINSPIELPELTLSNGKPEVFIDFGSSISPCIIRPTEENGDYIYMVLNSIIPL